MNDDDKYLRDLFAGFAMCGYVMQRNYPPHDLTKLSYEVADLMMEARDKNEAGIAGIGKRKYTRKTEET
jgi:hypothetical protein